MSASASTHSPRPTIIPVNPDDVPAEYADSPRFVAWGLTQRRGKWTKPPINPHTGQRAESDDATTFGTMDEAFAARNRLGLDGIGYVLPPDRSRSFVDLDHCRNPITGEIAPWGMRIVRRIPTRWDISPTGTGLKGHAWGSFPENRVIKVEDGGQVEMWSNGKYTTIGKHLAGTPLVVAHCQGALDALYAELCPPRPTAQPKTPTIDLTADDETIVERLRDSPKLRDLLDQCDWSAHGFPSQSEGDSALCWGIRRAGASSEEQIDRIFRASACMREKWDTHPTYAPKTVHDAFTMTEPWEGWNRLKAPTTIGEGSHRTDNDRRPPEPSSDPCTSVRDELAELRRENARLQRENTELRQRAETARHYRELWMATARVLRNPKLRPGEKMAGLSLIVEVDDANRTGRADADGWVEVPLERISERAGCAAGTAGRHIDTLASTGVVETDTRPIPGKRHARRVARFPAIPATDDAAPTLTDRIATLANAAPERTDAGWGGARRCREHPHADTITTTTTVVTCAECGKVLGKPMTRRRRTAAIVTQDAALSGNVETGEALTQDPIVNENDSPRTTTVGLHTADPIVTQDDGLSPRLFDHPNPIVPQDARLSPAPRPGGLIERVRTPRPEVWP